ncbi:BLUF domain-containing protein [Massilia sp. W12]|uniref:BLUF domain-containing protein n=1 Tax=Massilia sp. W12 TaxID=3126507 RepID=UPI0030CFE170
MLVRLLYASRVVGGMNQELISDILAKARKNNPSAGLTGVLCYGGEIFLQVLEGGRDQVNAVYGKILRDPRHKDMVLLEYGEIAERHFNNWTMGQVNLSKLNPSVLLKYSSLPQLDPYTVSGKASMALLEELIAIASIVGHA